MRKLIYLALKNVFRNRRRIILMVLILAFSSMVLILYAGFTDYVYWGYRESLIHGDYGHIQLYEPVSQSDFRLSTSLNFSILCFCVNF